MRSVQLQAALTAYLESVSRALTVELHEGAEIPFELVQQPRSRGSRGPALSTYRPLTVAFLAGRRATLEALPEYAEAAAALSGFEGLDRYLAAVGEDVSRLSAPARVRAGIASLLGEVFDEQSDFELRPERMAAALERLQCTVLASASEVTIVATLHGMTITSPELQLTGGLTIATLDALDGLPPDALDRGERDEEHLVVVLSTEEEDPRTALGRGREVLRDLLRALRLFGDGRVTLGGLAWARIGAGPWSALPVGAGGRPHGMLVVTAEQEDELRAFCNLVSRRAPVGNQLAWALRRFEMGCEREDVHEALTDNLLALRALLEPEGPASGLLAPRLAALCATPERRFDLAERTVRAQALERAVIAGGAGPQAGARALAGDLADHLRALLRDVVCGHLDPDLVGLADELRAPAAAEPAEPLSQPVPDQAAATPEPAGTVQQALSELAEPQPIRVEQAGGDAASELQLFGYSSEAEEILDLLV